MLTTLDVPNDVGQKKEWKSIELSGWSIIMDFLYVCTVCLHPLGDKSGVSLDTIILSNIHTVDIDKYMLVSFELYRNHGLQQTKYRVRLSQW